MANMNDVGAAYVAELFRAGASLGEAVDALDAIVAAHDAEVARKTLEDVIERVLGPSDRLRDVGTCRDIAEELRDVLRARAASISTETTDTSKVSPPDTFKVSIHKLSAEKAGMGE